MTSKKCFHFVEASATGTLTMVAMLANEQVKEAASVAVLFVRRQETPLNIKTLFDPRVVLVEFNFTGLVNKFKSVISLRRYIAKSQPLSLFLHSSVAGFVGRLLFFGSSNVHLYYIPHCVSTMRRDVGLIKRFIFSSLEALAARSGAVTIACSRSEFEHIKNNIGGDNLFLVENAINQNNIPRRNKLDVDSNMVVNVGGLRAQKRPEMFAEISKLSQERGYPLRFKWIGDGGVAYKHLLEASGVEVTGWLDRDDVLKQLAVAGVLLSTSRWEGMPVVPIEAACIGLPLYLSVCDGNVDVCLSDEYGFVDVEGALSALKEYLVHSNEIQNIFCETRGEYIKRFSMDRYINDLERCMRIAECKNLGAMSESGKT